MPTHHAPIASNLSSFTVAGLDMFVLKSKKRQLR